MPKCEKIKNDNIKRYSPDISVGLSIEELQERVSNNLVNHDVSIPTKTIPQIIISHTFTLFNLINFILAVMVFWVGSYKNLLFMGVILSNLVIGVVQEIRAKLVVDRLSIISSPKTQCIRNSIKTEIGINEIVLDDLLIFSAGNQISVDSIVVNGECEVNESLITGESDLIHKKVGDMLLSGSFIVSGKCIAKVEHIGSDNYAAQISKDAKYLKKISSDIMKSLKQIIRLVSILIVPIGLLLLMGQIKLPGNDLKDAIVNTAAALVAMIPEGLVLLTSTVLAVSVIRLSKYKVLVQQLFCIESLARVDTLCLDKTGTITEGSMKFNKIENVSNVSVKEVEDVLSAIVMSIDDNSPTFQAIKEAFRENSGNYRIKSIVPFSSERKWLSATMDNNDTYYLGAAEFILGNKILKISDIIENASVENRVLLLAKGTNSLSDSIVATNVEPIALILIQDIIREQAPTTLDFFAEQGVDIKIISGDNVITVANIARRAGVKNSEKYIDMSTVKTEDEIKTICESYTVFGRVTPVQKKQLILALKEKGHTVAMTGDGVNDVLALKEADCSIAMASGSDVARNVSQLVLLESNFEAMPHVVSEGRRSINNIQRSASLFLVKTIYATLLALVFMFVNIRYPFVPIQLTLISVMTIGIPSFVLALEPNGERVSGNFLTNIISKAIPCALTIMTNIFIIAGLSHSMYLHHETMSTLCVVSTGIIGLIYLFKVCLPLNVIRTVLFLSMCVGFTLGICMFKNIFSISAIQTENALLLIILLLIAIALFLFYNKIFKLLLAKFEKNK